MDKYYLTKSRAKQIATGRGIKRLPAQGREVLTVRACMPDQVVGHDQDGYYIDYTTGVIIFG